MKGYEKHEFVRKDDPKDTTHCAECGLDRRNPVHE